MVADVNAKINAKGKQGTLMPPNQGDTPLHRAAEVIPGDDLAELLIAQGADVNAKNNEGKTPLQLALKRENMDVVVLLIAKGAQFTDKEVTSKDKQGYTLLHYAARGDSKRAIELLIAKGIQVNANNNESGSTPLHWAAAHGSKNVAQMLIAKGADVNAEDNSSKTPLYYAIKRYKKSSQRSQKLYQYLSLFYPHEKQEIVKESKDSTEIVKLLKNYGGRE